MVGPVREIKEKTVDGSHKIIKLPRPVKGVNFFLIYFEPFTDYPSGSFMKCLIIVNIGMCYRTNEQKTSSK